jgi:LmbE family N-acetylglucosaminyl deacetylase
MTQVLQLMLGNSFGVQALNADLSKLDILLGSRGIAVLAPHPDDDILGCGALMAAAAAKGRDVYVIYLTDGGASRPDLTANERCDLVNCRRNEAIAGLYEIGIPKQNAIFIGAPDGQLYKSAEHCKLATLKLHELIHQGYISSVFVTSDTDGHSDHKAAYGLALGAIQHGHGVKLYAYPVSSRIDEFNQPEPISRFPIAFNGQAFLTRKRAALTCHKSQLEPIAGTQGFILAPEIVDKMCDGLEYFASVDIAYV